MRLPVSNATLVKPPAKPGEVLRPESNGDGYQIFGTVNIRILKARVSLWSVSTVPNLPVFQPVRPERFKKEIRMVLSWFTVNNALVVKRAWQLVPSAFRNSILKVSCKSVIYVSTNA
jgi:hypothetical protein